MIALFFWTVELGKVREIGLGRNTIKLTVLGLAILFSVSRAAIGGALISLFLLVCGFLRRRTALLVLIAAASLIVFLGIKSMYPAGKRGEVGRYERYREYSFKVSLKVFKDHAITGVGPGMYGGHVSIRHNSPIYAQYGFTGEHFDYLKYGVMSIEQLWLQALAELGVLGTVLLTLLLLTPIFILSKLLSRENDTTLRGLIRGLQVMPFQMMFYMFGFTITQESQWLVPYFGFLGMLAGLKRRR
jgi:O-antigen ligase